jgi:hypothetical protein
MSHFFIEGGVTVWSSANRPARLFVEMADAASRLVGSETGLSTIESDETQIDRRAFAAFTEALCDVYRSTNHGLLRSLIEPVMVTSLALLSQIDPANVPSDLGADLERRAGDLGRSLPR